MKQIIGVILVTTPIFFAMLLQEHFGNNLFPQTKEEWYLTIFFAMVQILGGFLLFSTDKPDKELSEKNKTQQLTIVKIAETRDNYIQYNLDLQNEIMRLKDRYFTVEQIEALREQAYEHGVNTGQGINN